MKKSELQQIIREEIQKVISEVEALKSGQQIDDLDLTNMGYIKKRDIGSWWKLFTADAYNSTRYQFDAPKFIESANQWLEKHGYNFRVKNVTTPDRGETKIWTIK